MWSDTSLWVRFSFFFFFFFFNNEPCGTCFPVIFCIWVWVEFPFEIGFLKLWPVLHCFSIPSPRSFLEGPCHLQARNLVAQMVKCMSTVRETWVRSLGREDPLEKEMAIYSSTIAWKIPWTEEPGRLQSMGSQRVGHDWATSLNLCEMPQSASTTVVDTRNVRTGAVLPPACPSDNSQAESQRLLCLGWKWEWHVPEQHPRTYVPVFLLLNFHPQENPIPCQAEVLGI